MTIDKKWKSGLLKTGLPLEYVASNVLSKSGHTIFGTYPYIRPDESKELKEFSVDIRTHKCLDSKERLVILSFLVECKYRQPDTSWIFSPFPGTLIPIGLIQSTEDLVPVRLNWNTLWNHEQTIGYCISGIELNKNGDGTADGLKHGIFQLRYAMPVLLKNNYESILNHNWSDGRNYDLLCPILVTTAEIRIIKQNLNLSNFTEAAVLNDVTEVRDAIILNERPGPQLQEFADSLADEFIGKHPQLPERLSELEGVLIGQEWDNRVAPSIDTIRRSFSSSTERILVVNFNAFENVIKNLESTILKEIESEKVYGRVIRTKEGYSISKL